MTILRCDKCGYENVSSDKFWVVCVIAQYQGISTSVMHPSHNILVCFDCLNEIGMVDSGSVSKIIEYIQRILKIDRGG